MMTSSESRSIPTSSRRRSSYDPSSRTLCLLGPAARSARIPVEIRENGFTGIEVKILPRLNGINPTRNGRLLSGMAAPNTPGQSHAGSGTTTLEP